VAQQNIQRLGLSDRVLLLQGDLFEPLAGHVDQEPFDLIVSNPPYIASDKLPTLDRSVRDYEPKVALDAGPDAIAFHRRILAGAASRLRPGGRVFLEIAFDQGRAAYAMASQSADFSDVRILKDHAGNDRVLTATRNHPADVS
jgi:release factor glutamine methyltransferase